MGAFLFCVSIFTFFNLIIAYEFAEQGHKQTSGVIVGTSLCVYAIAVILIGIRTIVL